MAVPCEPRPAERLQPRRNNAVGCLPTEANVRLHIGEALFAKAKKVARTRGTTLRQLAIEGLQIVLERAGRSQPFRLRDASYGKGGLVEGLAETDWDKIREITYQGRGG